MKKLKRNIAIFSVLALMAAQGQLMHASDQSPENVQKFEETLKLADLGDAVAQVQLGSMYFFGTGVDQSYEEAIEWYLKAADQEDVHAQFNIGAMYRDGRGVKQDYTVAIEWFQKATDQGDASAQYTLGSMYRNGKGIDQDYKLAIEWFQKAADQGQVDAQSNLADIHYFGQSVNINLEEAFGWYQKAADQGYASAQFNLGIMYQKGQSVNINLEEAFGWYQKAADQEYVNAQSQLGSMYYFGKGVDQNYGEAIKWYLKAADQKYVNAQYQLGIMYQTGQGVKQDVEEALKWYLKAADQGYTNAQYGVGAIYQNGIGIERDLTQSLKWYLEAFKNKNTQANLKNSIKNIIGFVPSTIFSENEMNLSLDQKILKEKVYETNIKESQLTLKNNIDAYLGLHNIEKGVNQPGSLFKERDLAIPSLFEPYQKISKFDDILLKIIHGYDQPGFMVTCLRPKDVNVFKSSKCSDVKHYELEGQSYFTFGKDNIEAADQLIDILLNTDETQIYGRAISDVLRIQSRVLESYQTEASKLQHELRFKKLSTDQYSDIMKELIYQNQLIKRVSNEVDSLTQLQDISQQLEELLIKGAPYRSKQFLKKENHIESIFGN